MTLNIPDWQKFESALNGFPLPSKKWHKKLTAMDEKPFENDHLLSTPKSKNVYCQVSHENSKQAHLGDDSINRGKYVLRCFP